MSDPTLTLLQQIIACPSVTPDDAGCMEILAARLEPLGFSCEFINRNGVTNLWARRGSARPLFVFAGHTDVVPTGPLDKWTSPPFAPEIRDKETMQAAIAYAQTGHLCLATLHANNSYHALNRIISFFPLENRPALFLDLSVALRAIVSQRLVRKPEGNRTPACEVMLNTRHISELIERGEVQGIKDAMEQTLAPGSQTFEQDLFRLYRTGTIALEEALINAV